MTKRRWKAPNDPTPIARALWVQLYGTPWPRGWRVQWVGFMRGAAGLYTPSSKRILLSYGDLKKPPPGEIGALETLLHEFIHLRGARRHDRDFLRLLNATRAKLGLDPTTPEREWGSRRKQSDTGDLTA